MTRLACTSAVIALLAGVYPTAGCIDTTPPWARAVPEAGVPDSKAIVDSQPSGVGDKPASDARDGGSGTSDPATDSRPNLPEVQPTDAQTIPGPEVQPALDTGADATGVDAAPSAPVDATAPSPDTAVVAERPTDTPPQDAPADGPAKTTAGLLAYYSFDQTSGTTVSDVSGNNQSATLSGQCDFVSGRVNQAISLTPSVPGSSDASPSSSGYVILPAGLLDKATAMTISIWVRLNSNPAWARILDFNNNADPTLPYMFLTPNAQATSGLRFTIKPPASTGIFQQVIDGPAIPTGTWKHIAVVLDGKSGRLYVDGTLAASNASMTLRPVDLAGTTNAWLGRSYSSADPPFDGQMDELRIYNRALSASEIAVLAIP